MDSTAMGPPRSTPPQPFGVYAPPRPQTFSDFAAATNAFTTPGDYSLAGHSHGFAPSMGPGAFGVPDWDGGSFSLSDLDADIIGPSQTHDTPAPHTQEDAFTPSPAVVPRPTRLHQAPDALTYSEGHIPRRVRGVRNKRARGSGHGH